ncbi:MAG: branched-chain amino acid ABC transporter permease, partial [Allobaculum sp.]|nr:branched-chain amino acid ABC transporter permease [Allobaculum sp.]
MNQFLQQMINGLSLGSIYALVALGYTMVYGIIKLINFAHGDIYMIGAYTAFFVTTYLGFGFIPALIACMVVCGILGVLIERIAYKPLRKAPRITALITAIGVSYVIEYTTQLFMGTSVRTFPKLLPETSFQFWGLRISYIQMVIFTVTIALMVMLTFIIQRTKIGRAMRAVSADESGAKLMGISVDNTISFTFLIGSALAGAAGLLVGLYY